MIAIARMVCGIIPMNTGTAKRTNRLRLSCGTGGKFSSKITPRITTSSPRVVTERLRNIGGSNALSEPTFFPRPEYPRPDRQRGTVEGYDWLNLNGPWQFRFDGERRGVEESWFAPDG